MLRCDRVSCEGERVLTRPGGGTLTLRVDGGTDPAGPPDEPEWRTASLTRRWRYRFTDDRGRLLYRGCVEDLTLLNTSTGRSFNTVSFELDYCGEERSARSFSACGTEPDRASALASLRAAAHHHHLARPVGAPSARDGM